MRLVLFALLVIGTVYAQVCEAPAGSRCLYVSPLGSDAGDGSFGQPFSTIQYAVGQMRAGEVLYLRGGTYEEIGIYLDANFWHGNSTHWYTIKSYPGEWAIIDGQHNPPTSDWWDTSIFSGTSQGGRMGYLRFENLEITGAGIDVGEPGYPSTGAGIMMRGGPFEFRRLYIHDNYGSASDNNAGLKLGNGVCNTTVEYCRFRGNGEVRAASRTTSVANVLFYSDYAYAGAVSLYNSENKCTATFGNIVRYNLFEAGAGSGFTTTGFKHKGMQRLTGYLNADKGDTADAFPNDARYERFGDNIHHNIFLDHMVGIELDQDYSQVHHNIIVMKDWGEGPNNAIQGRDENSDRRGPFKLAIYNNLIKAGNLTGIRIHLVPQGWTGTVPYIKSYIYNNIIDSAAGDYDAEDISIESDLVTAQSYPLADLQVSRNYFYNPPDSQLVYIHNQKYTESEIEATAAADDVFSGDFSPSDPLYQGTEGSARYKTRREHILEGTVHIDDGGIGGAHPYLSGIPIPDYVGPCPDDDCAWVDDILALSEVRDGIPVNLVESAGMTDGRLMEIINQWKKGEMTITSLLDAIKRWKEDL